MIARTDAMVLEQGLTGNAIAQPNGDIVACNHVFAEMFGFASVKAATKSNVLSLLRSRKEGAELLDMVRQRHMLDRYEVEMRRQDGEPVYVVARLRGIFDEEARLTELHVFLFNDTIRKRVEQQLVEGQKMESLGTLAGGIAHDFNNILGIIHGYASRLELAARKPDELPRATRAIKETVERGASLVQQLLTAAQQSETRVAPLDLNGLVLTTADMLASTFPKTITFAFALEPNLPLVAGDRTQLEQVLLNLCANARDAMPDGGTLTLDTRVATGGEVAEHFTGTEPRDYALLRVRDTGTGMTREVRAHIFEPFFTTKERGKATGLGLSIVYGVVNHHHGFVRVDSAPGTGTTFTLYLPLACETRVETGRDTSRGTGRAPQLILLVEDEDMLRDLGVNFLQGEGYRVLAAKDGAEGVQMFEAHRDDIGLVVCDLGLPKLDGRQVFARMKRTRPGVRVIVASGYLEPAARAELAAAGVIETLQKPFDFNDLVAKVRAIIGPPQKEDEHPQLF